MPIARHVVRIEWGDCDAAGITFYPNYFRWFDAAAWRLFGQAGFDAATLMASRGVFLPIVEAGARFQRTDHGRTLHATRRARYRERQRAAREAPVKAAAARDASRSGG